MPGSQVGCQPGGAQFVSANRLVDSAPSLGADREVKDEYSRSSTLAEVALLLPEEQRR